MPVKPEDGASPGTQELQPYRNQLDQINAEIVNLLAERMSICRNIARIKSANGLPMMQPQRVSSTLNQVTALSQERLLRPEYLKRLFEVIIKETCDEETRIMKNEHSDN